MAALAVDLVTFYTAGAKPSEPRMELPWRAPRASECWNDIGGPSECLPRDKCRRSCSHHSDAGRSPEQRRRSGSVVVVTFNNGSPQFHSNPHVTVQVSRTDCRSFSLAYGKYRSDRQSNIHGGGVQLFGIEHDDGCCALVALNLCKTMAVTQSRPHEQYQRTTFNP